MNQPDTRLCIVSTVGTSLFTNGCTPEVGSLLRRTANLKQREYSPADLIAVNDRIATVSAALQHASRTDVQRMSAELNGILALKSEVAANMHYLLCTDTYQGGRAAELVCNWLNSNGTRGSAATVPLKGLTTASQEAFDEGIDSLLEWCDGTLPALRSQNYKIVFNLVGAFKSLQAYAQTLGMVYADEICYVFEAPNSPLLRIPRLPIKFNDEPLRSNAAIIARMATTQTSAPKSELPDLPEAYLTVIGSDSELSVWGKLAWNLVRHKILAGDLLEQPCLVAEESFRKDYAGRKDPEERVALQSALAKVAVIYKSLGLAGLRSDGGLQYGNLNGDVGHFRVGLAQRVSCQPVAGQLHLRHYGPHDYVNNNP